MVRSSSPICIYLLPSFFFGNPAWGSGLGQNLPADHIRAVDFPFTVADADVLEDRIATAIERVRDNLLALVREAGIDLSDYFSFVVASLHFKPP
jgi:hypothetical protein